MAKRLELKDFFLTKLCVEWDPSDGLHPLDDSGKEEGPVRIEHEIVRRTADQPLYALKLCVQIVPTGKETHSGYRVDAEIVGLLRFHQGSPEEKVRQILRTNGAVILYGVLRGQIAAFTGSFLAGKFMLPTVNMAEILTGAEGAEIPAVGDDDLFDDSSSWSPQAN